ncbi:hypothetical protein E4U32_003819 [Claviceps aff. humidiphila group G2b]|nr:hypothetical protein E4U32_003819 [Claviceps aff. humidiphila group G2b]
MRNHSGYHGLRPLLKAAITKADVGTLWIEVVTLTATLNATHTATSPSTPRSTSPPHRSVPTTQTSSPSINVSEHHRLNAATISPNSTVSQHLQSPPKCTTASVANSSEQRSENEIGLLLKQELEGRLDIDMPGFFEKFFPSSDYQQTAEEFLDRCKTGAVPAFNNGWETWRDRAAETEVVTWLKLLSDELEEFSRASFSSDVSPSRRRAIYSIPKKPIHGATATQELDHDVGFVSSAGLEHGPEGCMYSGAEILAHGKLMSDYMADEAQEAGYALARKAQDMLAAQGTRRFSLGFTLCGPDMRVWLFDRLGGIASEQIDIHTEPIQFIKVMLGFLWMSEEDLGFDSSIEGSEETRYLKIEKNGSKKCILLDQERKRMPCIVGRGTTCWKAHDKDDPATVLVMKDSWQEVKRDQEGEMLLHATRKGVVNVARHYHHETVQIRGMDDDVRKCIRRGLVKATASSSAQSDPQRSSGVPSIGLRKRRMTSTEETSSELRPRKRICSSWPTKTAIEPLTELLTELPNRVHRRIIVRDYGKAIYTASSRLALLACLEGCITGHQSLYEAGILHRDVSLNNLMINEESATNKSWPHFLIDLDQAIYTDRHDPSERTKVGTRAFMAIGLLEGEEHSFLHDLESFFWVLFWICIHFGQSGQGSRTVPRYDRWHDLDDERLASAKRLTVRLHSDFAAAADRDFVPYYKPLIPYVNQLRELLPFNSDSELPGQASTTSEVPKKTGFELYSQMVGVLREAQRDPEVRAE